MPTPTTLTVLPREAPGEAPITLATVAGPQAARVDPATAYLSRYTSAHSRRAMEASLRTVAGILAGRKVTDVRAVPWQAVRYEHAQAVRVALAGRYAVTSANRHLTALRGIVTECWRLGLVEKDVADRVADVPVVQGTVREKGRALRLEEVKALYEACDASPVGRRNAAVLVLCLGAGLRRSEACLLDMAHFDEASGKLSILGKGNKWRDVFLSPNAQAQIKSWLDVRGRMPGPLVTPCDHRQQLRRGARLTDDGVYSVLEALGKKAKVADFAPHDLRRTFITTLLEKGADVLAVSKLAGHASVQTTARYDKRGDEAKKNATRLLDF
jgi:site-specific recombinase XerD